MRLEVVEKKIIHKINLAYIQWFIKLQLFFDGVWMDQNLHHTDQLITQQSYKRPYRFAFEQWSIPNPS